MEIITDKKRMAAIESSRHFRRETRMTESVDPNKGADRDLVTMLYTLRVQMRVLGVWVTVWSETCDYSDGDGRRYLRICDEEVIEKLNAEI